MLSYLFLYPQISQSGKLFFLTGKEKIEPIHKELYPKNYHQALKNLDLGSEIRYPEEKNISDPDPEVKKAPV